MDSEKKRSDEYWMGVRDALRMVDSFTKWAGRNKHRAKSLDDFIHDGLVAAARRCESCLKDDLGLTFVEKEEDVDNEEVPSGYTMTSPPQEISEVEDTFEVPPDDITPGSSEVPIETEDEVISIESVARLEDEEMDDISMDGPPREFASDFDLVEPTDLDVDSVDTTPEKDEEETPEPEEVDQTPSFTWADYEKAVAPTKIDPDLDEDEEDVELPPPIELESHMTSVPESELEPEPESPTIPEDMQIPEPPMIPPDEIDEDISESDDSSETITEPPPPPPPPESDEDEEERRRRARRLFFGD